MKEIRIKAAAKINLFLRVLNRRPDGFHDIYSLFQAVGLFDSLVFFRKKQNEFRLTITGENHLPTDDRNLVVKTARMLFSEFGLPGGLEINLIKRIPVSSGLGGGSSDAAATIYAIDRLFDLNLTSERKATLGLRIGSDVPFFFSSGQAEISGRGEKISEILLPTDYSIILINPRFAVSTAESYRRLNFALTTPGHHIKFTPCDDFSELVAQIRNIGNDFEEIHLKAFSVLAEIRDVLKKTGAALVRMSGSGPTIFGLYEKKPDMGNVSEIIRGNWRVFVAHPITLPAWNPEEKQVTFGREEKPWKSQR
jgi:4-diphosphocytidyl-2-C-methyl-D-erythritol kinase